MGRHGRVPEWFGSVLSGLRDGGLAAADYLKHYLSVFGYEFHTRAIAGSAKLCWVLVDIRHARYLSPGFLSELDSQLRVLNAIQTSLNDWLGSGRLRLLYSVGQSCWGEVLPEDPSEASVPSYAVVVSALALLSLVYQYLTGNVDRGGSKAYSRSPLDFRDVYVATVLFLGAYVWIKFREVAFKGVHTRKREHKDGGTKVVYEARLKPPLWNGKKVPRLDLGRFATPHEAHNKFLIAAFYYNRAAGLLDGWFPVPPMSEEERRLAGLEKRRWVIGQAKKVYEDFKKKEVEALEQHQAMQERTEVNVDPCGESLVNSAEHQQPPLVCQVENSGVGMGMIGDNHGLECPSLSFDGEGFALPNSHSLGSQEGSALPVFQLPPNTESGVNLNVNDQLDSLQTIVRTLQQQISDQQQQIQESAAQILQLQQQLLQESRIQNPQWSYQFCLQEQQLEDVNQGVPGFQMEMAQSMHEQNFPGLIPPPPDGGEVQEVFWEMDTLW